jgi:starvation-inducible outer membrane lipoprotein
MVAGLLAASLMLSGCVASLAQLQNEQTKTKDDFRHMQTEQQERDNYTACVNQGALPGSPENLECRLELAKKEQQASKPQTPPAKQP